jgi:hypothetical protein
MAFTFAPSRERWFRLDYDATVAHLSNAYYSSVINAIDFYRVFLVGVGPNCELTSMTFEMLLKRKAGAFRTLLGLLHASPKTNVVGL